MNFGLLQGQVKSRYFSERIVVKRQYLYSLYIFLGIIGWKRHWTIPCDTDLNLLLPFKWNWLERHMNNSSWMQKIPNFAIVFQTQRIV